jgi:two-component system chemotaxis sensor kinase CheA
MSTNVLEQIRETFRSEALDLLVELDTSLLELESQPGDLTLVHRVFRAIHTIKGSGATAGFAHLARFAHQMEEAFDLAREGRLAVSPELIDCGLKACDVLKLILEERAEESVVAGEVDATGAFARLLPASQNEATARRGNGNESQRSGEVRAAFEIVLKPNRDMF